MTLTEITRPYETLIRHHSDGTIGAHHQTITEIQRDGVTIPGQASINAPQQLDTVSTGPGSLNEILGETTTLALASNTDLQNQLAVVTATLDASQEAYATLVSSSEQQLTAANETSTALGEQLVGVTADRDSLSQQLASALTELETTQAELVAANDLIAQLRADLDATQQALAKANAPADSE